MNNLQMVMWLRGKMNTIEEEIKYLEELLTTTSGSAEQVISDLKIEKYRLDEYRSAYNKILAEMEEEKKLQNS
jgi:hypothetical protein